MILTKERKVLGVILSLGVTALAVDRLMLGSETTGPSTATASVIPELSPNIVPVIEATPIISIADAGSADQPTLADRLEAVAQKQEMGLSDVHDAFEPSSKWRVSQKSQTSINSQALSAKQFKQHHRLSAVMAAGRGGRAIVDGKTIRLGQVMDEYQLVSVNQRSAVFESNGNRLTLTLNVDLPAE